MKFFRLPETDEEKRRVPPKQRIAKGFPILTDGESQTLSSEEWKLKIWTSDQSHIWDYEQLLEFESEHFTADFHCVTHWSKLDVTWTGVRVLKLLEKFELRPIEKFAMVHCYGGYTTNLRLEDLLKPSSFLAYELNQKALPAERGGPVRLVVPHLYAWKSAKWISGIEILDQEQLGYWEQNGYHRRGDPWQQERYSHP